MKRLKILLACTIAFAMMAPTVSQAQTSKWISTEFRKQSTLTTTDSAYNTIATIPIAANEAGILDVQVTGYNDSLSIAVTGRQVVRYKKVAGTLTLGTPSNILAKETDTGLQYTNIGSTWDISTSSDNIIIRVKGKLTYKIKWESRVKPQILRPG